MLRTIRMAAWVAVAVAGFLIVAIAAGWIATDGLLRTGSEAPGQANASGPFNMTDHRNRKVTERDFRGKPMAIFFGFTNCPDICPTALSEMSALIESLGPDAERNHWVFVGVDWERDTPDAMAAILESFDERIVGLSGSESQIAEIAKSFRVYYRRVPLESGGYTMDHSAGIYLVDQEGRLVGLLDPHSPQEVNLVKIRNMVAGS